MKTWKEYVSGKNPTVVVIQGSARSKDCCPGENSKSHKIIEEITKFEKINFDVIDLSVQCDGVIVQPCKACVSTAGGFHCHYECDCYSKDNKDVPDFMHNNDVYKRIKNSDGIFVCTPINWSSVSSVVKSFFDRLVCCNLTITDKEAKYIFDGDVKNPKKTKAAEQSGNYNYLLKNHYEGKHAAFLLMAIMEVLITMSFLPTKEFLCPCYPLLIISGMVINLMVKAMKIPKIVCFR